MNIMNNFDNSFVEVMAREAIVEHNEDVERLISIIRSLESKLQRVVNILGSEPGDYTSSDLSELLEELTHGIAK